MSTRILQRNHSKTRVKPVYGGNVAMIEYYVQTNTRNNYTVTCQLRGLETGEPYFDVVKVVAHNNNENTLTGEALADLLGWDSGEVEFSFDRDLEEV